MTRDVFEWAYSKDGHNLKTFPAALEDDIYHADNWKQFDDRGVALLDGKPAYQVAGWGGLVLNEIDSTSEEISEDRLRAVVTDKGAIRELLNVKNVLVEPVMPGKRSRITLRELGVNNSSVIMEIDDGEGGLKDLELPIQYCTRVQEQIDLGNESNWLLINKNGWITHIISHEGEAISSGIDSTLYSQTAKIRSTTYRMAPTINVKKSLLSRVKATRVNLSRDMLLKSPLLRKGVVFSFDKSYGKIIDKAFKTGFDTFVYPYRDGVMFSLINERAVNIHNYYLSFNRLPLRLDEASIKRMFKLPRDNEHTRKSIIHRDGIYEGIKQMVRDGKDASVVQEWFVKAQFADQMGAVLPAMTDVRIDEMELVQDEPTSYMRDILPFIMKLIVAYSSPELRGDLRRKRVSAGKKNGAQANGDTPKQLRQWVWGNDRVVYIYPDSTAKGGPRASCYVRPHHCTFLIKNTEKYKEYDPIPRGEKWEIVKWREGHFRGSGDFTLPEFNAGAQPRSYSLKAIAWLKRLMREQDLFIQHAENMGELHLPIDGGRYYKADGYCKTTNTIYEFYGDYWHGNPEVYSPNDTNSKTGKTMGELYENTVTREKALRDMGFNVVTVWESDYDRIVRA